VGIGYDRAKTPNSATRFMVGGIYYFNWPIIVQGGATFTRAAPGDVIATTGNLAITEGREKEHLITARAEMGREGYEVVGVSNTLFDFPVHIYSGNWRQWIGMNWGFNFNFEREVNTYYNRNGATLGLFFDF
jgi:YaiO family outer membrane protein